MIVANDTAVRPFKLKFRLSLLQAVLLMISFTTGRVNASGNEFDLTPEEMTNSAVIVKVLPPHEGVKTMEHIQIVTTSRDRFKAEDWEAVLWVYSGTNLIERAPLEMQVIPATSREMPAGSTEHGALYECDLSTDLLASSKISLTYTFPHGESFFCYWIRPADFARIK